VSAKPTPAQEAKGIAAAQLRAFLQAGQPMEDCGCDDGERPRCRRCKAVVRAIDKLAARLDDGAGHSPPETPTFIPGDAATGRRWQWVREDGDG
jgi:hypothetical protein